MRKKLVLLPVGLLLGILSCARVEGQAAPATASGASTHAPAATPPAQPIALANVVTEAVAASGKLQDIQTSLASDQTVTVADQSLPAATTEIDEREGDDARMLQSNPTLPVLRSAQATWESVAGGLRDTNQTLANRISQLDAQVAQLGKMHDQWEATLAAAKSSATPADILSRIQNVLTTITATSKATSDLRGTLLSAQSRVTDQADRVTTALAVITKAKASAVNLLFTRDSVPIWALDETVPEAAAANRVTFPAQMQALGVYLADKIPTLFIHLLLFLVLAVALIWARRELRVRAGEDPAVANAAHVLEVPLATATVLALLASTWLYPVPPRLLLAALGAAALLPSVIILRRLIGRELFPVLYAMVLSYLTDQVRSVFTGSPVLSRTLFLVEMLAAAGFLLWLLGSRRISAGVEKEGRLQRVVRIYAFVALVIFGLAAAANILGYTHLSFQAGNAMLESGYLAVILYAAVRILDGLIITLLKIRPLSSFGMVQRHDPMLGRRASLTIRWLAVLLWLSVTLELFSLRTPLLARIGAVLNYSVPYGSINLSLKPLLLFGLTVWATLLISRFVRFILEEEVFPHLTLGPGVPYAASTMVHYVILTVGTLFALAAIKVDLSQYTVLAGALGVGLGFGLQNIMNNFVSGIILLFERPIKVGDIIQVDTSAGTVERIGIRASVIRLTNGSEIIMPNGNLISNPVTNWNFSNRQRVIDIPVAVAAKSDPQKVMSVLIEIAKNHPVVLKEPAPQVLFTNLTGASLNFELRAWTNKNEAWTQVRSELFLAISTGLAQENIVMA